MRGQQRTRSVWIPAPPFSEVLGDEAEAPSGLVMDLGEEQQDFFLFTPNAKTFGCNCQAAKGSTRYASAEYCQMPIYALKGVQIFTCL